MALLLALVSFVTVVLILGGLLLLAGGGRRQEVIRRRLASIEKAQKRGSTSLELELMRDELLSDVPVIHQMLLRWSWAGRLRTFIWQAGLRIKPGQLVLVSAVLAMGAGGCAPAGFCVLRAPAALARLQADLPRGPRPARPPHPRWTRTEHGH